MLAAVVLLLAAGSAEPAFRFQDEQIVESSALVISRRDPTLAYTVNDSGDSARVFVVDTSSGETVGVTTLSGVENEDFEALAFAPGGRLLVGDIGDNDAERESVQVHLIEEPGRGDATVTPLTVDLTYPSRPESTAGPGDAEALWVRGNRIYLASKTVLRGTVFRGPAIDPLPGSAVLRTVGVAPGVVTDATVLADGRLVLRNYSHAFVVGPSWEVVQTVPLPEARLGESVAAPPRGDWVYAGAEGAGSTVHRVAIPPYSPSPEPGPPPPPAEESGDGGEWPVWAAVLLAAVLTAGVIGVRSRR
jgi:hypothetical protein